MGPPPPAPEPPPGTPPGPLGLGDGPCGGGAWCTSGWGTWCTGGCGCGTWTGGWVTTGCGGDTCVGAWITGGLTTGSGTGTWTGGTGTGTSSGVTTTGTGATGAAGTGAAGKGAAGSGAATAGFNGLGAATGVGKLIFGFGTDASTGANAGACWAGTMRCWPGVDCKATVVRMPIARAISSASTALMPATANPLPINRTGLRPGWPSSGLRASGMSMTTVGALASSSGTAL
jgi:hypothetical protein